MIDYVWTHCKTKYDRSVTCIVNKGVTATPGLACRKQDYCESHTPRKYRLAGECTKSENTSQLALVRFRYVQSSGVPLQYLLIQCHGILWLGVLFLNIILNIVLDIVCRFIVLVQHFLILVHFLRLSVIA